LGADDRMKMLFDDGKYTRVAMRKAIVDPLKFRDLKKYNDRLKDAQKKTGMDDAIVVAHGNMDGQETVMAAFDFSFMGGSMGLAVGHAIITASREAVKRGAPLVILPSSGGARMQEGIHSLMQMARTTIAVEEVREAGLPYIVVLCDPTTGGVTASFAMLGDIHIAEPGAVIGFAGARVIEQTIRETLPEGFQRSEYLLEHGMVDMVVERKDLRETLGRVISLLMRPVASDDGPVAATKTEIIVPATVEVLPPEDLEPAPVIITDAVATESKDDGDDKRK